MSTLTSRIDMVRDAISKAREGLEPKDDQTVLEEIATDIEGHLECLADEADDE